MRKSTTVISISIHYANMLLPCWTLLQQI